MQTVILLLGKPILNGEILSLDPSKLAQFLSEHVQENRAARSSAIIQETDAEDFPCLLRVGHSPTQRECDSEDEKPHPFSIFDFGF
jgi:hypothetical protein